MSNTLSNRLLVRELTRRLNNNNTNIEITIFLLLLLLYDNRKDEKCHSIDYLFLRAFVLEIGISAKKFDEEVL